MNSFSKQSGHAAILFVLIIPALFGVFTWGLEGSRLMQNKARMTDGLEAAALAITARASADEGLNNELAEEYLSFYMPDAQELVQINIEKRTCEMIPECMEGLENGEMRFFEYEVTGGSEHKTWFPGLGNIAGFGDSVVVSDKSAARKYQSQAADVILVADHSGSMDDRWQGGDQRKIEDLYDVIQLVTDDLQKFNNVDGHAKNTVGLVPFNYHTNIEQDRDGDNECYVDQYRYRGWGRFDEERTIEKMFDEKTQCVRENNGAEFINLELTEDFDEFNDTLTEFRADGGTASAQGIIRAGQMALTGDNPRRIIIILSDGKDTDGNDRKLSDLVDAGMCEDILQEIESEFTSDNERVEAKLAVVGFDYDVRDNQGLADCVGEENVFLAENPQDILNQILELISEEIGHLH